MDVSGEVPKVIVNTAFLACPSIAARRFAPMAPIHGADPQPWSEGRGARGIWGSSGTAIDPGILPAKIYHS